jgi:virulence-associated protein VapD
MRTRRPQVHSGANRQGLVSLDGGIGPGHNRWSLPAPEKPSRMYAIAFDLDQEALRTHYHGAYPNHAYDDIRKVLQEHGLVRQQGSVWFGDHTVTPVTCVMAVQAVQKRFPWFNRVLSDIRMLRIEENNDLMPALGEIEVGPAGS